MKRLLLGICGVALLSSVAIVEGQQPTSNIAAQVGDTSITFQELDEGWKQLNPGERARAVETVYEGQRHALDQMITAILVKRAANAKGMTVDQFMAEEMSKRTSPVTQAALEFFYATNKDQMQGKPFAEVQAEIRNYLEGQQRDEAHRALEAELRKAGPPIRILIEAPRYEVTVAPQDPFRGRSPAPVTIVEFSDYQCPFCRSVAPALRKVLDTYGDQVRIVWKDFPLTEIHPDAFKAAEAAHCAGDQGRYWEYHDTLFGNQTALDVPALKQRAAGMGLDAAKFNACLDGSQYSGQVREGLDAGVRLGISGTPTIFINGRMVDGVQSYDVYARVVDEELAARRTP